MTHHHDAMINLPLAVLALLTWWFLPMIESASHFAAVLVPFGALVVAGLQIWYLVRKLRR